MRIPIKTFEELTAREQREHLESLIEEHIAGSEAVTIADLIKTLQSSESFQNWQPEADGIPTAYSPQQVAKAWNISDEFVRLLFESEAGVLRLGKGERLTMRIPKPVMLRVFKKWQKMTRRTK